MEIDNNTQKYTEVLQKVKRHNEGFKNEINEVVDDFTSVITNYIVELQSHFEGVLQIHNKEIIALKKEIEDKQKNYQFEESNYNRVSFIKQQDKEINDAKIKIEELEMKLRYAEKQLKDYKSTPIKTNTIDLDTSHLEEKTSTKSDDKVQTVVIEDNNTSSETKNCELSQCLARIGRKRYKFDTLSEDEQNAYPSNVFISKSGYVLGKSCPIMVKLENDFCEEHSDGFDNITLKPYREKRKKKQKQEDKQEEVQQEEVQQEEEVVVEITDPLTFDNIDMYESDGGTSYYEDMREQYKGYLYEITEDEEIGAFVKIKK